MDRRSGTRVRGRDLSQSFAEAFHTFRQSRQHPNHSEMKLHYFQDPSGNFGDDLNPWLWRRLAPGLLDDDDSELFVGIGTLINHRLPSAPVKHIMGSGLGYGLRPVIDDRFVFHAVRGYGTARALGLSEDAVITDAAALLRALDWTPRASVRPKVNIVLTGESLRSFDWQPVCDAAGIGLISCHEKVEAVLSAIRGSELILAEAMHGAIAADTLRVPWIAVTCNPNILTSKWQDWLSSLDLRYAPLHIQPLFDGGCRLRGADRVKRLAKLALARTGAYRMPGLDRRRRSSQADVERAVQQLRHAARSQPTLSDATVLDRCVDRLLARLGALAATRPGTTLQAR